MRAADQFHTGVVVPDLEAALAELTALFGCEWCDEVRVDQPVRLPTGDTTVELQFRYSRSTPRREVIQQQPGTLWMPADSGLHHLGYWSDDVAADSAALEQAGNVHEASGTGPDGSPTWAYHRSPTGPRIELVSRALEPFLALMWT